MEVELPGKRPCTLVGCWSVGRSVCHDYILLSEHLSQYGALFVDAGGTYVTGKHWLVTNIPGNKWLIVIWIEMWIINLKEGLNYLRVHIPHGY